MSETANRNRSTDIAEQRLQSLLDTERAVLGGLMLDANMISRITLSPSDFTTPNHRYIFSAIQQLAAQRVVPEALAVAEQLERDGILGQGAWLEPVARMVNNTASSANVPHYATIVRNASLARQAQAIAVRLQERCSDFAPRQGDPNDLIDSSIRELMELTKDQTQWSCNQLEVLSSAVDYMELISSGKIGVSYGIRALDEKLGGMHPEDFVVVASRPAMGKTAFLLNMALGCNVHNGVMSGEQSRAQMGMRQLAIDGLIALQRMRKGTMVDEDWARLNTAMQRLRTLPSWMNDKPSPTIQEVRRQATVWKYEHDIKLLMVDYLQKIRGGEGENRATQIGDVAGQLKTLARELKIPVVALAQVNREVEKNPLGTDGMGRMPFAGDIRESGVIEAEADTILTQYRPSVYLPDDPRFFNLAIFNVCKSRHGPVGFIEATWQGEYLKFGDLADTERR